VDLVFEQGFADAGARGSGDLGALGAEFGVGKDLDDRHGVWFF
jgi:hypothetical protein